MYLSLFLRRPASALAAALLLVAVAGCGTSTPPLRDEGPPDDMAVPEGDFGLPPDLGPLPECDEDSTLGQVCQFSADCSDDCFCNGLEVCNGGVCGRGDPPCDDGSVCTVDSCNEAEAACRNPPDDDLCDDDNVCNGVEVCDGENGCLPGTPLNCSDGDLCTVDSCDPVAGCMNALRDLDGDGFVSDQCDGLDCNDNEETGAEINPDAEEICDDGVDNNCDTLIDLNDGDACGPTNDTCVSPIVLRVPAAPDYLPYTQAFSTFGVVDDFELDCEGGGTQLDVVFEFTLPDIRDVSFELNANQSSLELRGPDDCDDDAAEPIACDVDNFGTDTALIEVEDLEPGTYSLIVSVQTETIFDLEVSMSPPIPAPPTDLCDVAMAPVITTSTAMSASFAGANDDYPALDCGDLAANDVDVAYRIQLASLQDVDISVTGNDGMGNDRDVRYALVSDCTMPNMTAEGCAESDGATGNLISVAGLPAGTYWLLIEPDDPMMDVVGYSIDVDILPPLPGDFCATAIDIGSSMGSVNVMRLTADEGLSCAPVTWKDAFFEFNVGVTSDVVINTTAPSTHFLGLSSDCTSTAGQLECLSSGGVSGSIMRNGLAPGDYYVIVATPSATGTVTASVTITASP
ncbi:MAG: putative metal-binding motif-containing protein [Sandaracinaceae bacterium]